MVSAEWLKDKFYEICNECNSSVIFIDRIIDEIDDAPDVEVVHGRWEDMYDGKYANPRFCCSVCKEKSLFKDERNVLVSSFQALTPFCPHCGAALDGG